MLSDRIFDIYNRNTLHGFNPHVKDGFFLGIIYNHIPREKCLAIAEHPQIKEVCHICEGCRGTEEMSMTDLEKIIRKETGIDSIEIWSTYGGDCLKIDRKDRTQIKRIIDAAMKNPIHLLQTSLEPVYYPGESFSIELSEAKVIPRFREYLSDPKIRWVLEDKSYLYGDERLWKTVEGKDLARAIYEHFPKKRDEMTCPMYLVDLNPFVEGIDYPMIASHDRENNPMRAASELMPILKADECMVCFNAEPNTIVRPCGHQIVCAACSPQLIGTIDEKICLLCRRPITAVEYC